jgi:hypothetical protein
MENDTKVMMSFRIHKNVHRALKVDAARLGVSISEVVEGAIRLWLQGRPATQEQAVDETKPVNWADS